MIAPADIRRILLADAVSLGLGVSLLIAGLLTLMAWGIARRRAASLQWLGLFGLLYGLRMLLRTTTLRICFDWPPAVWDHAGAAITYTIPLPLVLFAGAIVPAWRRRSNWIAAGVAAFATCAIASDAILRRPYSASRPTTCSRSPSSWPCWSGCSVRASRPRANCARCAPACWRCP